MKEMGRIVVLYSTWRFETGYALRMCRVHLSVGRTFVVYVGLWWCRCLNECANAQQVCGSMCWCFTVYHCNEKQEKELCVKVVNQKSRFKNFLT